LIININQSGNNNTNNLNNNQIPDGSFQAKIAETLHSKKKTNLLNPLNLGGPDYSTDKDRPDRSQISVTPTKNVRF